MLLFGLDSYNPGQNIWHKVKKSSKTGQDFKNLLSNFACFLTAIRKAPQIRSLGFKFLADFLKYFEKLKGCFFQMN